MSNPDPYGDMYRGGPPRRTPPRPRYADPAQPPQPPLAYWPPQPGPKQFRPRMLRPGRPGASAASSCGCSWPSR